MSLNEMFEGELLFEARTCTNLGILGFGKLPFA